jgi:hypothetical protein
MTMGEYGDQEEFKLLCDELNITVDVLFLTWDELMSLSASEAEGFLSRMELINEQLRNDIRKLEIDVEQNLQKLTAKRDTLITLLRDTSFPAHPSNIKIIRQQTNENKERLSEFLKNHEQRGHLVSFSNPSLKQLSLRYEHYLFKYKEHIIDLAGGGDVSFERLINETRYLDSIIEENPKAVLARGFLFMLAQCVYHQKVEPSQLMKFISVTNMLDNEDKQFLAKRAFVTASGADMNEKVDMIVAWLKDFGIEPIYSDFHSRGYHMNYLVLPAFDCNIGFIEAHNTDLNGKVYTDDQVKEYLTSLDSKPFLSEDFGYKRIITTNDLLFHNQFNLGHHHHDVFSIEMFDYKIDDTDQLAISNKSP